MWRVCIIRLWCRPCSAYCSALMDFPALPCPALQYIAVQCNAVALVYSSTSIQCTECLEFTTLHYSIVQCSVLYSTTTVLLQYYSSIVPCTMLFCASIAIIFPLTFWLYSATATQYEPSKGVADHYEELQQVDVSALFRQLKNFDKELSEITLNNMKEVDDVLIVVADFLEKMDCVKRISVANTKMSNQIGMVSRYTVTSRNFIFKKKWFVSVILIQKVQLYNTIFLTFRITFLYRMKLLKCLFEVKKTLSVFCFKEQVSHSWSIHW